VKLTSGIAPDVVYEFGITEHFGVAGAPPGLMARQPVVVPDPHRDAEHQASRHPARQDQLGEVLAGQVGGERPPSDPEAIDSLPGPGVKAAARTLRAAR
jgi:hypothetical protein